MRTISQTPRGLLSLLQLGTSGDVPRDLANQVVATVELVELFLLNDRRAETGYSVAAPVVGSNFFGTPLAIPPGELWYVHQYFVQCSPGAGAAIDMCPAIAFENTNTACPLAPYQAATANQQVRVGADRPFWAAAGSNFGVLVRSQTLQPAINGTAVISRLRV